MEPIIRAKNIKKYFKVPSGNLLAVDDISFDIFEGETLGLVGESGCGKSTAGRTVIRLYEPTGGELFFKDKDVFKMNKRELHDVRKDFQMIFQDPYASLNPRMTVLDIVAEPLDVHGIPANSKERYERVIQLLDRVGLSEEHAMRFPHEFSGGQRQRVGIARSLATEPKFIVCDEPISALDVSIQAQVVNLLQDLQDEMGLTYLFIAHDLSMVRYISDRVAVMYLGKFMELAESEELYNNPMHPYTKALLSAIPVPDPAIQRARKRIMLEGDVPSPINVKPGCRFVERCSYAKDICRSESPEFKEYSTGHFVACHLTEEIN
ncbi:MAG: ATP-binding cassette domain-containing protein [Tissierellia bacterium]|nr:ATP-binding cassette domain-containing protein [Tissierellia bacterium]